jgi:3-oxoacyl-[acyl-carrier protein] reductase
MRLVMADIDGDSLDRAGADLERQGAEAHRFHGDLSRADDIERLFVSGFEAFGAVDLLVNNAADLRRATTLDQPPELLDQQLATNVSAPYRCSQRAAAIMKEQGRGVIVNLSSVGAIRAHHLGLPYDVTKGAINSMTQAMAIDLGPYGIRVNAIGPGATHTYRIDSVDPEIRRQVAEVIPLRRYGTVADMAAAVAFLASDDASYITGQTIYVDGGISAQLSPPGSRL